MTESRIFARQGPLEIHRLFSHVDVDRRRGFPLQGGYLGSGRGHGNRVVSAVERGEEAQVHALPALRRSYSRALPIVGKAETLRRCGDVGSEHHLIAVGEGRAARDRYHAVVHLPLREYVYLVRRGGRRAEELAERRPHVQLRSALIPGIIPAFDRKSLARGNALEQLVGGGGHGVAIFQRLPFQLRILICERSFVHLVVVLADVHPVHPFKRRLQRHALGYPHIGHRRAVIVHGAGEDVSAEVDVAPIQVGSRVLIRVQHIGEVLFVLAYVEDFPAPAEPGGQYLALDNAVRFAVVFEGDVNFPLVQIARQNVRRHGEQFIAVFLVCGGIEVGAEDVYFPLIHIKQWEGARVIIQKAHVLYGYIRIRLDIYAFYALLGEQSRADRAHLLAVEGLRNDDVFALALERALYLVTIR